MNKESELNSGATNRYQGLQSPYWGALTQDAPLRRWRLIEMGVGNALAICPLRLDEQIVHYLTGLHPLDERLKRLGAFPLQIEKLVASHHALAEQMASCWVQASQENRVIHVLQLCGTEGVSKKAIVCVSRAGHVLVGGYDCL